MIHFADALFNPANIGVQGRASLLLDNEITLSL